MQAITSIHKMTSMEISEVTGKQHKNILADIRDEAEKLEKAGIDSGLKFQLSERKDCTGRKLPYYELTKEGVLQLAARYDAVVRAKLIDMALKSEQPYQQMSPELQAIFAHDRMIQDIRSRLEKLEQSTKTQYTFVAKEKRAIPHFRSNPKTENFTYKKVLGVEIPILTVYNKIVMAAKTAGIIHQKPSNTRISSYIINGLKTGRYVLGKDVIDAKGTPELEQMLIDSGVYSLRGVYRSATLFLLTATGYEKLMMYAYTGYALDQYPEVLKEYFKA